MEAYTGFAQVYDKFMDNIEYDKWCEYLVSILKEYGVNDGIVLDLGCGTGNITELLADKGYDMIGVDYSQEMLNMAIEKRKKQVTMALKKQIKRGGKSDNTKETK